MKQQENEKIPYIQGSFLSRLKCKDAYEQMHVTGSLHSFIRSKPKKDEIQQVGKQIKQLLRYRQLKNVLMELFSLIEQRGRVQLASQVEQKIESSIQQKVKDLQLVMGDKSNKIKIWINNCQAYAKYYARRNIQKQKIKKQAKRSSNQQQQKLQQMERENDNLQRNRRDLQQKLDYLQKIMKQIQKDRDQKLEGLKLIGEKLFSLAQVEKILRKQNGQSLEKILPRMAQDKIKDLEAENEQLKVENAILSRQRIQWANQTNITKKKYNLFQEQPSDILKEFSKKYAQMAVKEQMANSRLDSLKKLMTEKEVDNIKLRTQLEKLNKRTIQKTT